MITSPGAPGASDAGPAGPGPSGLVIEEQSAAAEPHVDGVADKATRQAGGVLARLGLDVRPGPVWQGLIALAIYLGCWLALGAYPLLHHPAWAQVQQNGMDPNFYVWGLRWWTYALSHGLNPFHTTLDQVPAGVNLAWTTTIPPLAILAWPITALFGPVVSFNLLVILSLPISGWAAFILCRRITGRFWASLAAGAVYGYCAYQTSHLLEGQLNLSFDPLLPLMGYLIVLWLERKIRARWFVPLLGIAIAAQCYMFIETFADLSAILPVALLCAYLLVGRERRPVITKLAKHVGLAYLVAIVLVAPFLFEAMRQIPSGFVRSPDGVALDLMATVIVKHGNILGLGAFTPHMRSVWSRGGFVGVPIIIAAIALTVTNWSNKFVRFLAIMLGFTFLAALGPAVRVNGGPVFAFPWFPLWYLPLVRSSFPVRIMVFAFLALTVMAAVWLTRPSKTRWHLAVRWVVVILGILAMVTNTPELPIRHSPGVPAFITSGQYRQYLAPGSTVVVISTYTGNAGILWQAESDFYFRVAGGFFNEALGEDVIPPSISALIQGKTVTPNQISNFHTFVRKSDLTAILVQNGSANAWHALFHRLGLKAHYLRSGVTLYRITQKFRQDQNFGTA